MYSCPCENSPVNSLLRSRLALIFQHKPQFSWGKLMEGVVAELYGVKWNECLLPTCFVSLASCGLLNWGGGGCCIVIHIQGYTVTSYICLCSTFFLFLYTEPFPHNSNFRQCILIAWNRKFVVITFLQNTCQP